MVIAATVVVKRLFTVCFPVRVDLLHQLFGITLCRCRYFFLYRLFLVRIGFYVRTVYKYCTWR